MNTRTNNLVNLSHITFLCLWGMSTYLSSFHFWMTGWHYSRIQEYRIHENLYNHNQDKMCIIAATYIRRYSSGVLSSCLHVYMQNTRDMWVASLFLTLVHTLQGTYVYTYFVVLVSQLVRRIESINSSIQILH